MIILLKTDLIGKKFNHLLVLNEHRKKGSITEWKCLCDCGNTTWVARGKIISGHTKSCGCLNHSLNNLSKHPLYSIYSNMKDRCYNINSIGYKNWGKRGIIICQEWKDNFLNFYNWAIQNGYKKGLSIDRINNNGSYCPENCRWITVAENTAKSNKETIRRKSKYIYFAITPDNEYIEFTNATIFAKENNIKDNTIYKCVNNKQDKTKNGWKFGYTNKLNI